MTRRRKNPAAGVPVLLMNPDEDTENMATRRKTAARKSNPRRRRRRASPARRRRVTRRRNPKFDIMGGLVAGLAGAAVGGGAYALQGVNLDPKWKMALLALGGLGAGIAVSGWSPTAGCAIAGGGVALATKQALDTYMATTAEGMGYIPAYAYRKFGPTPTHPHYYHMPYNAQLNAIQADLGAVQAPLGAVYADLT